jgi:hypothetical protein
MKRASFLFLTLLMFTLLSIIVVAQMPEDGKQLPDMAQVRLGQFLTGESWSGKAYVIETARARRPWLFAEEWGKGDAGNGTRLLTSQESPVLSALHFPPDCLWCVLLKRVAPLAGEEPYEVVFIGLHSTMYNADWVVHRATDYLGSPPPLEVLSTLDCDLGLASVGPHREDLD